MSVFIHVCICLSIGFRVSRSSTFIRCLSIYRYVYTKNREKDRKEGLNSIGQN